ncbi:MAG: hypothetical protein QM501_15560 [Gimesia sp.]
MYELKQELTKMDVFRLNHLREEDVDQIVLNAGGKRAVPDHCVETEMNADYLFDDAIIELKLIEEEGLEKETRRVKVADIFRKIQEDRPVVILDPNLLDKKSLQKYQNAMEGPIKTQVKKSAKQLFSTWEKNKSHLRVLLIINNGYSALNEEEFETTVKKCATNDTTKIDYVICAGLYYYSDQFDVNFFSVFQLFPIREECEFPSFAKLKICWEGYIQDLLKSMILDECEIEKPKIPVIDLEYELQGIKYLKPAPKMGKSSEYYPNGIRPRFNSTGIEACPPVGVAFPKLSKEEWSAFKKHLPQEGLLQNEYVDWRSFLREEMKKNNEKLKPAIEVNVYFEQFQEWCGQKKKKINFSNLCYFSFLIFDAQVKSVIHYSKTNEEIQIRYPRYIYLITEEIGRDKANDMTSVFYVSEIPGIEREEVLLSNQLLFFEYGLSIASAYAVKYDTSVVLYKKDKTYCWE